MASRQYHEVLRQIDIATVLPHGVEFLREAKGPCESTYDLSEPMMLGTDYDDFVSHTWRTNPRMKWFLLLYEYNGKLANQAAHITGFVVFLLQLFARFGLGWTLPIHFTLVVPGAGAWHPRGPEAAAAGARRPERPGTRISTLSMFMTSRRISER